MQRRYLVVGLFMALALVMSCGKSEEEAVARVGEDIITVAMLRDEYLAISMEARPMLNTIEEKEQFARDAFAQLERELLAAYEGTEQERLPVRRIT